MIQVDDEGGTATYSNFSRCKLYRVGKFRNKNPCRASSDSRPTIKESLRCEINVEVTSLAHTVSWIGGSAQYHIVCFTVISFLTLIAFCSQNPLPISPSRTAFRTKQYIGTGIDVEITYTSLFGGRVCIAI